MSESFTFTKTSEVFDRSKIGVGDIIEFDDTPFVNPFRRKQKTRRMAALVTEVEDTTVWISVGERNPDSGTVRIQSAFGLPVSRADEITMIYRHPDNVSRKE
ncbi:hypothetical protein [Salibacterium lacus]|uniref:Uncharacterized protein n=1 Tax=Salibacterium lacus TaxID=1898109 RepID=A0ABW5SY55_9BACI